MNTETNQDVIIQEDSDLPYTNHSQPQWPETFEEVEGGYYDIYGCYFLPDGSFWDINKVYFNRDGLDANDGSYDENFNYHPGPNWNEELQCYISPDQIPNHFKEKFINGIQESLEEEYDHNKGLFQTIHEPNIDLDNVEMVEVDANKIDNNNGLILEWMDSKLIQNQEPLVQNQPSTEISRNLESTSPFKGMAPIQDENQNPNRLTFEENMSDSLATPFKTKTSEIIRQETPFKTCSVKKVTLTTPKSRAPSQI